MALGWAIYGTWNWWTWWLHEILEHEMSLYIFLNTNNSNNTNVFLHTWTRDFFEHEIRRRPTDRREVITRITRIFFLHTELIFFAHGSHGSHGSLFAAVRSHLNMRFFWTRILHEFYLAHGSHFLSTRISLTDLEPSARCEWQLVTVIGSLWLLTCYVLNDKSKKISVSHAKHRQIREICEIRVRNKYIRAIRSSCERTAANKDLWDPCA